MVLDGLVVGAWVGGAAVVGLVAFVVGLGVEGAGVICLGVEGWGVVDKGVMGARVETVPFPKSVIKLLLHNMKYCKVCVLVS